MKKPSVPDSTPFAEPVFGEPEDVWELTNKYGTYEVQDTTDTENTFPCIGPDGSHVVEEISPDQVKKGQQ